ncbi:M48 family metallopeptidase [Permianibacter sp. IMCC34836]|uniref:M48 family metallopeptidase n=1 Tax=Permianibacter fluminis TaxID=2738515 RepID=UPI001551684F|nr:M48 family metallopeptidase [Permianibacter fluminis]NQD35431.1 M48 family metallopeptidase [Permianibacter fluminis]
MDFFGRQDWARRRSKWLVGYFILAVVMIVVAVNAATYFAFRISGVTKLPPAEWFGSAAFGWLSLITLIVIALGSLLKMAQLSGGGQAVADMVGARRVLPETSDPLERRLINVVEEMAIASGTPLPRIYVMDEEQGINAFVAGLKAEETVLVVTRGALQQLNRQELQGVIGHEYSHIMHSDMRLNVKLMGVLAGILLLGQFGEFLLRSLRHVGGGRSKKDSGNIVLAMIILAIALLVIGYVGLFFGRLIKSAISRQREFLADASSVQYTRDNSGIAGALTKIKLASGSSLLQSAHAEEMSHMCFGESVHVAMSGLLSTHPPLDDRISALGFTPAVLARRVSQAASNVVAGNDVAGNEVAVESAASSALASAGVSALSGHAAARQAVASVGTVTPSHLDYAQQLLERLPAPLREASHDRQRAGALMLALMLTESAGQQVAALNLIEQQRGPAERAQVTALLFAARALPADGRLALITSARPALEMLREPERQQLLSTLLALARLDQTITPFEYVLSALLRHWLQPAASRSATTAITRFAAVADELALVIGLVTQASGSRADEMSAHYKQTLSSFGISAADLPVEFDAVKLDQALLTLDRLTPLLKKPLLSTLAELALADQEVTVNERELLRVIAERLNCPMPPLLAR